MGERREAYVRLLVALLQRDPLNLGRPYQRLREAAELASEACSRGEPSPLHVLEQALRCSAEKYAGSPS